MVVEDGDVGICELSGLGEEDDQVDTFDDGRGGGIGGYIVDDRTGRMDEELSVDGEVEGGTGRVDVVVDCELLGSDADPEELGMLDDEIDVEGTLVDSSEDGVEVERSVVVLDEDSLLS
ncbi:hypothetical protein ES702_00203 [subsurface metagenome]